MKIKNATPVAVQIVRSNSYFVYLLTKEVAEYMPAMLVTDNLDELLNEMENLV
jgi:hypothetical protein